MRLAFRRIFPFVSDFGSGREREGGCSRCRRRRGEKRGGERECVHVVKEATTEAAEKDTCAICKRRHAVTMSSAWSVTIAAQRRPRCTGPRHSECVHVVEVRRTTDAAEKHRCTICKCGHAVILTSGWSVTIAAQRRPRCTGPRHGQCVHVVQEVGILAAEEDYGAICKRRHTVTKSCAWSVTLAGQQGPQFIGTRQGQSVHVVQVVATVSAEKDRCTICKRRHAVKISSAWSVSIAAQRRPRCTGPRHGQCVYTSFWKEPLLPPNRTAVPSSHAVML